MKLKYLFTGLISIILFSCEKTVNIKIPDSGRKLVVNSFFAEDSILKVNLSKSKYILDGESEFESVKNAKIILYKNNIKIEELIDSLNGFYYGNYILKAGSKYKLEVSAKDFPTSKAESDLPLRTKIIELSGYQSMDEYGWPETAFNLTFKDDAETEHYYFISVTERRYTKYNLSEGKDTVIIDDYELNVYSTDPNTFSDDWYLNKGVVLKDDLFNGKEYKLFFKAYRDFYDSNESTSVYYVKFSTISKEYYLYYISYAKHVNAQDEFFMEPVQVYTNIENGFGIFAGYSTDVDSVVLENNQSPL